MSNVSAFWTRFSILCEDVSKATQYGSIQILDLSKDFIFEFKLSNLKKGLCFSIEFHIPSISQYPFGAFDWKMVNHFGNTRYDYIAWLT